MPLSFLDLKHYLLCLRLFGHTSMNCLPFDPSLIVEIPKADTLHQQEVNLKRFPEM